jgi:hypothetical protein
MEKGRMMEERRRDWVGIGKFLNVWVGGVG